MRVCGNRIIVGAPKRSEGGNSAQGAIYVYDRVGGSWTFAEKATLAPPVRSNFNYGDHLRVDPRNLVVGAPFMGRAFAFSGGCHVGSWAVSGRKRDLARTSACFVYRLKPEQFDRDHPGAQLKILLTGSSGRIGQAIHAELVRAHLVIGVDLTLLRMSRCFPEPAHLMAAYRLYRGIDARDVARAHAALGSADPGLRTHVISAATPFRHEDLADLAWRKRLGRQSSRRVTLHARLRPAGEFVFGSECCQQAFERMAQPSLPFVGVAAGGQRGAEQALAVEAHRMVVGQHALALR